MNEKIIVYEPRKGKPVRVFRPCEIRSLVRAIPKNEYKDKFEALLYSAMRYKELQWLYKNPRRFHGDSIHVKNTKFKIKEAYRYVHINMQGQRAVENFLRSKTNLPTYQSWGENLKRWCVLADIPADHACAKSTRKTFESWLVISHPHRTLEILASVGHEETTALKHYLTFPFSEKDKQDMFYFVEGW
jgi:hypothetical protein